MENIFREPYNRPGSSLCTQSLIDICILYLIYYDRKHLENDIARVYSLMIYEWLRYVKYLKESYAYLFSLAVRINPFNPEASAIVKT